MALNTLLGGLIGGIGSSTSARTGTTATSGTSTPSYSPAQTGLQNQLLTTLGDLAGGSASPELQAMKTQSADQINQNYSGLGDRMNRFLAARGFGQSGSVGKAQLQTEVARQGALAGNESNYANLALQEQNTALSDALRAAYIPGSTSTSGYQVSVAPGSSLASALAGAFVGFNGGLNQMASSGGLN